MTDSRIDYPHLDFSTSSIHKTMCNKNSEPCLTDSILLEEYDSKYKHNQNVQKSLESIKLMLVEMQNNYKELRTEVKNIHQKIIELDKKLIDKDSRETNAAIRRYYVGKTDPIKFIPSTTKNPT